MRVLAVATGKRTHEWVARVIRACNYVEFKTRQNLPPVLKIVAQTVQLRVDISVSSRTIRIGLGRYTLARKWARHSSFTATIVFTRCYAFQVARFGQPAPCAWRVSDQSGRI